MFTKIAYKINENKEKLAMAEDCVRLGSTANKKQKNGKCKC